MISPTASPCNVSRLARVQRNVADLARAVAFHVEVLGFEVIDERHFDDLAWAAALGLPGARADTVTLRLGAQELELRAFESRGRAYPVASQSSDLWFQHIAIVVADMHAAYAELGRHALTPISINGPQTLPPTAGSVRAFKFRDPDGHPLELIHFPAGVGDPTWQQKPGLFLGMDHSAIGVGNVAASVDFYTRQLGFKVAARSLNHGPEQARLDAAPDALVDVVALQPAQAGPMHVELLGYRQPPSRAYPANTRADDIVADCLVFECAGMDSDGARVLRDPDGHYLKLDAASGVP